MDTRAWIKVITGVIASVCAALAAQAAKGGNPLSEWLQQYNSVIAGVGAASGMIFAFLDQTVAKGIERAAAAKGSKR